VIVSERKCVSKRERMREGVRKGERVHVFNREQTLAVTKYM